MVETAAQSFGAIDVVVNAAGVAPEEDGELESPHQFSEVLAVNVTGSYIVGDEAARTWKEQGLRGNLVLTTSANAVVAKKGSLA